MLSIVLDVLPDRQKASLTTWLKEPPRGIDLTQLEAVATDLWSHYRDAVHEVWGDRVSIVADRFHVMQNLHEAIHKTRRHAQQQAQTEEERKLLKGLRYLLLKKDESLTEAEVARLDALKITHPLLYELTRLRQRIYVWYETAHSLESALEELQKWLGDADRLGCKFLADFCQTLRNWQKEIVDFFCTESPAVLWKG